MVPSVTETANAANKLPAGAQVANGAIPNGAVPKTLPVQKLPTGQYTLVSVDIDTTGRRLIDEIVQLAAYTPKDHFEQYIMPYMNLNPAARQRHQVRVISIGFYRMLKSMQTSKIIKSKSEICALKDFLDWLEALKAKDPKSLGIILIYHEERKFIPYMLLQALKKYNLLDRFLDTVAAFTNSRLLAQNIFSNEPAVRQPYTLRRLARFINNKLVDKQNNNENKDIPQTIARICEGGNSSEAFDGSASVRARLTYEVAHFLCNMEQRHGLDSDAGLQHLFAALHEQAQPIEADLQELKIQNENVERQNSFRPVFFPYFKATLFHRVRAVKFRIVLAEHGYDLSNLNEIWQMQGRDGLLSAFQSVPVFKPEERHELADLFDSYFDPKKTVIGPIVKNNRRRNRRVSATTPRNGFRNEGNAAGTEPGASGDKQSSNGAAGQLPDSTTKSPIRSNGNGNGAGYNKSNRGKRIYPRVRNGIRSQRYNQQQPPHNNMQSNASAVAALNSGAGNKTVNAAAAMPQPQRIAVAN